MKLTLSNIKELKRKSDSSLTKRVCNYVIDRWGDYSDKKYIFTDVLHSGCQSGVVSELIYYSDTVRFYKQYRQEINVGHHDIRNNQVEFFCIECLQCGITVVNAFGAVAVITEMFTYRKVKFFIVFHN